MKRTFVFCLILAIFILFASIGLAKIPVPERTSSYVNDYAGIIDKNTRDYLKKLISSIEQKTPDPVEVIIATFRSLDGWRFEDFALEYGEKWRKIKKGRRDNGVILLIALQERRVTIGVGQNLRGILTPPVVNGIIQERISPEFSEGNYSKGIKKATEKIVEILDEAEIPADNPTLGARIILLAISLIIAFFIIRHLLLLKGR